MKRATQNKLINFIWFQCIWVLAIFTQYDYWWIMVGLLVGFFFFTRKPYTDALGMVLIVILGTLIDSALTLGGVYVFESPVYGVPIPLWLIALWAGFALTLGHSLNYLQSHLVICALLGAIFGPVSYWAGARFGAVGFPNSIISTLLILAIIWGVLFPTCMFIYRHCHARLSEKTALVN